MLDSNVVAKLKERYPKIHPLLFHRSIEHAKSNGHLFDILETVPEGLPIIWSDQENCWVRCTDVYQSREFFEELNQ
jgi:hypothetical protein